MKLKKIVWVFIGTLMLLVFVSLVSIAAIILGMNHDQSKVLSNKYLLVRVYGSVHDICRSDTREGVIPAPVDYYEVHDNLIIGYVGESLGGNVSGYFIIDTKTDRVYTKMKYKACHNLLVKYGCKESAHLKRPYAFW